VLVDFWYVIFGLDEDQRVAIEDGIQRQADPDIKCLISDIWQRFFVEQTVWTEIDRVEWQLEFASEQLIIKIEEEQQCPTQILWLMTVLFCVGPELHEKDCVRIGFDVSQDLLLDEH
jgi:hypothetical protein